MLDNSQLTEAIRARKDEFYTTLEDIEAELKYYKQHFRDKVVLCNCDDPYESNFFKYFALNFNKLGLKRLICTSYAGSPVIGLQLDLFSILGLPPETDLKRQAVRLEINAVSDFNGDGSVDITDIEWLLKNEKNALVHLKGDGSYDSPECLKDLEEADIVVTNPPFSLWRPYVDLLDRKNKKFLILGNINAVTYKDVFPLIKAGRLWLGASIHSGDRKFYVPDDYPLEASGCGVDEKTGRKYIRVKGVRWYTNLDYVERHDEMDLYKRYSKEEFPTCVNYDAINVDVTAEIPRDYPGKMAVPITFLDRFSPDQFELLGADFEFVEPISSYAPKGTYQPGGPALYLDNGNGTYKRLYKRLIIKNKKPEM